MNTKDQELEKSVEDVVERFGGDFCIKTGVKWKEVVSNFDGTVVHLTMYGIHIDEALPKIPDSRLLIIVGAEKVPGEVYQLADFNIGVGNQPHSEVAALAIFMDRLQKGEGLQMEFKGNIRVIPCERGKKVVNNSERN